MGRRRVKWTKEMVSCLGIMPDEDLEKLYNVPIRTIIKARNIRKIRKYPAEVNRKLLHKGLRICSACNVRKTLNQFFRRPSAPQGYFSQCKDCQNNRNRKYLRKLKMFWVQEMGGSCANCGYEGFLAGLVFHHIGDKAIDWGGGFLTKQLEDVYAELNNCILLCACCHNALHAKELQIDFIKSDELGWEIKQS